MPPGETNMARILICLVQHRTAWVLHGESRRDYRVHRHCGFPGGTQKRHDHMPDRELAVAIDVSGAQC